MKRRRFLSTLGGAFMGTAASGWLTARPSSWLPSPSHSSQLVRFGRTDLSVSRLCQGTAFRQLQRSPDDPRGERILRHCIDIGINFFDSSNTYGAGGSQKILGKAIAGQRDKVVICTKVAIKVPPENSLVLSRDYVLRQAEGSLRRLGTDYIDLYLYHFPDNVTPLEDLAETMNTLVQSGKIRYWGTSNFVPKDVVRLVEICEQKKLAPMVALEDGYGIAFGDRKEMMKNEMFPIIRRANLALMAFSPLGGGVLAPGRTVEKGSPLEKLIRKLDRVARQLGATRPQVCVAWVLTHPEVTSVIAGAEKPEHVDDNFQGTKLVLPSDAVALLNASSDVYTREMEQKAKAS